MWSLGRQEVVDLFDYLEMKYPAPLVSIIFGSVIRTFCSILHLYIIIYSFINFSSIIILFI